MVTLLLVLIYICFISLGLPDSLLGSCWPVLHQQINVPLSYAGIISGTICCGTIISSIFSDKLLKKFGTGLVTASSIALTAIGLFGFSTSTTFYALLLWAIPYGLGAGGVDAILNNYVANHYKAHHMSWLHCMWGIGASISPYIMSFALVNLNSWSKGYLIVAIIQIILSFFIFISIPLWKTTAKNEKEKINDEKILTFKEIFKIKGAIFCFIMFFCYCALELTTSLWASSYLVTRWNFTVDKAASLASMFYIGITFGRFINGFFAMKFNDRTLIFAGLILITTGIILLFIPFSYYFTIIGFIIIGLGCAPIYPCIIHMTPFVFGKNKSQAMIGIQMAFAYVGFLTMPPLFGIIAQKISILLLPVFQLIFLALLFLMHIMVIKKTKANNLNE